MSKTRISLQPKDSEFSCSKEFWRYTTSITFLSKIPSINAFHKASIYTLENRVVSKVEEVDMVGVVDD